MAIVKITFDGGDVPVVTGEQPHPPVNPIQNPVETGGTANHWFIVTAGLYCFALKTDQTYKPLWQTSDAIDGVPLLLHFKKVP